MKMTSGFKMLGMVALISVMGVQNVQGMKMEEKSQSDSGIDF